MAGGEATAHATASGAELVGDDRGVDGNDGPFAPAPIRRRFPLRESSDRPPDRIVECMNADPTVKARRLTEIAGWIYVASGLALAAASLWPAALAFVTSLVAPGAGPPDRVRGLFAGVAGGLTVGFGAALVGLARATTLAMAARAMATAVAAWFLVDTSASLAHGSWQNALGNVGFLVIGLLPLRALASQDGAARSGHNREPA